MNATNLLRVKAAEIAETAAELHDIEGLEATFEALMEDLAEAARAGTALDARPLAKLTGDDGTTARALRSLMFACFEVLGGELDSGTYAESALAVRQSIQPAIPHPPVPESERHFYGRLLSGDCEALEGDFCRLAHLFLDLSTTCRDVVYVHDLNGMVLYLNRPGLATTKFTAADVNTGLAVYDFVVPEYLDLIEARIESPGAVSRSPYSVEVYTKDGVRIPIEITTHVMVRGRDIVGVIGLARDLRLERRIEEQIRRTNAYLDAVVSQTPAGIIRTDGGGVVLEANPVAVELIGAASSRALVGAAVFDVCEESPNMWREAFQEALRTRGPAHRRLLHDTTYGAPLYADLTVVPLGHECQEEQCLIFFLAPVNPPTPINHP